MKTETKTPRVLVPRVDILESTAGLRLVADLPGTTDNDVELHLEKSALVLQARAPALGDAIWRRSFVLPRELDPESVKAHLADGVLTIDLPRKQEAQPRRIPVTFTG